MQTEDWHYVSSMSRFYRWGIKRYFDIDMQVNVDILPIVTGKLFDRMGIAYLERSSGAGQRYLSLLALVSKALLDRLQYGRILWQLLWHYLVETVTREFFWKWANRAVCRRKLPQGFSYAGSRTSEIERKSEEGLFCRSTRVMGWASVQGSAVSLFWQPIQACAQRRPVQICDNRYDSSLKCRMLYGLQTIVFIKESNHSWGMFKDPFCKWW